MPPDATDATIYSYTFTVHLVMPPDAPTFSYAVTVYLVMPPDGTDAT